MDRKIPNQEKTEPASKKRVDKKSRKNLVSQKVIPGTQILLTYVTYVWPPGSPNPNGVIYLNSIVNTESYKLLLILQRLFPSLFAILKLNVLKLTHP